MSILESYYVQDMDYSLVKETAAKRIEMVCDEILISIHKMQNMLDKIPLKRIKRTLIDNINQDVFEIDVYVLPSVPSDSIYENVLSLRENKNVIDSLLKSKDNLRIVVNASERMEVYLLETKHNIIMGLYHYPIESDTKDFITSFLRYLK